MDVSDPTRATTIPELIRAVAHAYGDQPAVRLDAEELSYAALERESGRRARGLLARGVGKGSRVGLWFGNGVEWAIWWAAISRTGAVCVPLSTFLQPAELARVVRHADLHGLIGTRSFLERDFARHLGVAFPSLGAADGPLLALPEAPFLRFVALEDGSPEPWCTTHGEIVAAGAGPVWAEVLAAAEAEVHPDDEAIVICTSGQSAEPKGVVHVHGAILEKVHYLRDMYQFDRGVSCQILLPFFWVGGLTMGLLPAMEVGGVAVCTDRSTWGSGQVVGAAIEQENPYAGMRMEPALGMTETFGIYSWGAEWRVPGHPLCAPIDALQPGFEIRVVDEAGNPVADGERGEVLLRGPTVARRLNKVRRSEVFDADGFYRTGDQAERDGERLHFTGRISDMIKTSGANVSPAEVERELLAFEEVEVAHVVAIDDAERGQVVGAAIVLVPGASLAAAEIRARLRDRLSSYKVPRKIVFLDSTDDVPMTPSTKVRRVELAAMIDAAPE
ncbi:MAG: class I adenylate-forming enzyme family protein [Acidimicrobiia bacterium]